MQGLSSSSSYRAPTASATSRPTSKRKSADANDLRVDDPKQVRLRAYPVSMFGAKKDASMLRGITGGIGWNILSNLMQRFAALAAIFNVKLEETCEELMRCKTAFATNRYRN